MYLAPSILGKNITGTKCPFVTCGLLNPVISQLIWYYGNGVYSTELENGNENNFYRLTLIQNLHHYLVNC
jgi:hypothetical protein